MGCRMVTAANIEFGQGAYGATEVERFAALDMGGGSVPRAQAWLRNVVRPLGHTPRRPDYSFRDLVSVFTIAHLSSCGVRLPQIRAAQEFLARRMDDPRPFSYNGLHTDGRDVYADFKEPGQLTNVSRGGQETGRNLIEVHLKRVEFRAAEAFSERRAEAWLPVEGVRVDPTIMLGAPCVADTRLPTAAVLQMVKRGITLEEIEFDYRVERDRLRQAIEFEEMLVSVG